MPPDPPAVRLSYVSLITPKVDALTEFYAAVFGLNEIESSRSHRYRELQCANLRIGIVFTDAYELLHLQGEADPSGVRALLTFAADDLATLHTLTDRAVARGARLMRDPFDTGYGVFLSVLLDPEGNALRISAPMP